MIGCGCGLHGIGKWEPDTEGQECHFLAGEEYMCLKCGDTLKISDFYSNFLRSKQWEDIRFRIFIRDSFTCQECGKESSEVHHKNYNNILDEETMISLCHECHCKIHKKDSDKKVGWEGSIQISKMAENHNFKNCPFCKEPFEFYDKNGFFCCYNCEIAGNIKSFASLIIEVNKLPKNTRKSEIVFKDKQKEPNKQKHKEESQD